MQEFNFNATEQTVKGWRSNQRNIEHADQYSGTDFAYETAITPSTRMGWSTANTTKPFSRTRHARLNRRRQDAESQLTGLPLKYAQRFYTGEHRKPLQDGQSKRKSADGVLGVHACPGFGGQNPLPMVSYTED